MDKKSFIKRFDLSDENIASNLYDKMVLAEKSNTDIYTNEFYTPNIWNNIESIKNEFDVNIYNYGIFQDSERRMMLFSTYDNTENYPLDLIGIRIKSKFFKPSHRDFLGSLMSLGIKRNKFGDLILKENQCCYLACASDVSEYIESNFTSVGNSRCDVDILDINDVQIPDYDFKTKILTVSSMRLDCIVSSLCNISRSKGEELIERKKVQINYIETLKRDKILSNNSTVIIRGYGKFKLVEEIGHTGKGRTKLLVKKFS